jgi:hypothetical protein
MRIHASYLALALAAFTSSGGRALAQPSRFGNGQIGVINAGTLVNEATGQAFGSEEDLLLTLRSPIDPRLRSAGRVQARIFTLLPGHNRPNFWARFDPCRVFYSVVIPVRIGGRQMNLGGLGMRFLNVQHGRVSEGHYLVVFEERTETSGIIRLNENDAERYFSRGLLIVVRPSITYSAQQIRARETQIVSGTAQVNREAQRNDPAYRCYRYRAAAAEDGAADRLVLQRNCLETPALSG